MFCHIYTIHLAPPESLIHPSPLTRHARSPARLPPPTPTPYDSVGAVAAHGAQLEASAVTSLFSMAPGAVPLLRRK